MDEGTSNIALLWRKYTVGENISGIVKLRFCAATVAAARESLPSQVF